MSRVYQLSIIVIGFRMPRQLEQTLHTLSCDYQQDVSENDYEVVIVENDSDKMLSSDFVEALPENFRYYSRHESGQSPVAAINFAFEKCQGEMIGLMIDGAHMVTPRVVKYVLCAQRAWEYPLVVVPGYHLGGESQTQDINYTEEREKELLRTIDWRDNGYQLFSVADFSPANRFSYMHPIMECNCVFTPRISFERIGYCDSRFTLRGGGPVNLHLFRQLGTLPETEIVVLPGEGSFHQYHGGVTTSSYADRENEIASHREQLNSFWLGRFKSVSREPVLLGAVTYWAHSFLQRSSQAAEKRYRRLIAQGFEEWEDDCRPDPIIPAKTLAEAQLSMKKRFQD